MIQFRAIQGKNFKVFIQILNITTKQDLELYEVVKTILTRTEFLPFKQGFNKNTTYTYLFNEYIFPVNFWTDVKKQLVKFVPDIILENEGLIYQNDIDREDFDNWVQSLKLPEEIDVTSEEYLYQRDSVFLAIQNKIGRIEVAMAGGKTFITFLYCLYLHEFILKDDEQILVVVPSKPLCTQLQKDFKDYGKYLKRGLSVETIFAGSKKIMFADVVCGTFQSLGNYDQEYFDSFKVFICDELHRAKSYTIRNEIYSKMLKCEFYFGMTGTMPQYKTLDYLHIVSMFGDLLVKRTMKENIDAGVSTPLKLHVIEIEYDKDKDFSYDLKAAGIIGIEKYVAEKAFFQSYESRTNIIAKLMNHFINNTLIMVDTVEYCDELKIFLEKHCDSQWKFHIIHGKISNRDEIFDMMRITENYFCIIGTYGTMSTGVNIKNIENLYLPDGGKSEFRIRQTLGRGIRLWPKKDFCNCFDFQDKMQFSAFLNHSRERNRVYRQEGVVPKISKVII